MVVLNLTLLVIVAMFLVFMFAMNRFVFRPLLQVMDERDAQIADDRAGAVSDAEQAERMEGEYAGNMAAIHHDANQRVQEAHRTAQREHSERVAALKSAEDQELAAVRAEAEAQVAAERAHFPALAGGLADAASGRLHLGGNAP